MKITDTLTSSPGTFNVQTALALARVSQAAYKEGGDLKKWAEDELGRSESKRVKCFKNKIIDERFGDLRGFFYDWEDESGANIGKCGILAFRGSTFNPINWIRNVDTSHTPHPWRWGATSTMGKIHRGFCNGILGFEQDLGRLDETIEELDHLWICGHSLGGALGVLAASRYRCMHLKETNTMEVYTFGQPWVGCEKFANAFVQKRAGKLYRLTNPLDFVPDFLESLKRGENYRHVGDWHRIIINSDGEVEIEYVEDSTQSETMTAVAEEHFEEEEEEEEEEWAAIMEKLEEIKWVDGSVPDDEIEPIYGDLSKLDYRQKLRDHAIKTYIHNLEKIIAIVPRSS